jgi:hypothetical protein
MTFTMLGAALRDVPVDPDAPEARQLLLDELAKPAYVRAQPNWFDRLVSGFLDWFQSLGLGAGGQPPPIGTAIIVAVIIAAIIVLFFVFGLPRLNRRSRVTGSLFGEDDARTAAVIRRFAEHAASQGDYTLAIAEMFRSIARGLAERTVLTTSPGTTAHDFGRRAGHVFPEYATALDAAALAFDGVRYLGVTGTADQYASVAALESNLRAAKPALLEEVGS